MTHQDIREGGREGEKDWVGNNLSSVGSRTSLNSTPTCNESPNRRHILRRMHCRERIPGGGGGGGGGREEREENREEEREGGRQEIGRKRGREGERGREGRETKRKER